MNIEKRYENVLNWFRKNMPAAKSELNYKNPYQLIVAVILSAQCTDKRVNIVTKDFFERYPDPQLLSQANISEIYESIKSVSYPNNKSKHLSGMAQMLVEKFAGEVPDSMEELQKLPGVGRKTANVILSVAFNQPAMAVDTHVFRVAERIGLTVDAKNPLATEKQLVNNIPASDLATAHHWLILHGRYVCVARKPKCEQCGISEYCKYHNDNYQTLS